MVLIRRMLNIDMVIGVWRDAEGNAFLILVVLPLHFAGEGDKAAGPASVNVGVVSILIARGFALNWSKGRVPTWG